VFGTVCDKFHGLLTKKFRTAVKILAPAIFVSKSMRSVTALTSIRRTVAAGDVPAGHSENILPQDQKDLIGRAASFRIEAQWLRARADAVDESLIRAQYLSLADRWATLAASLEAETMLRLDPR
jgi:hypothetical protein